MFKIEADVFVDAVNLDLGFQSTDEEKCAFVHAELIGPSDSGGREFKAVQLYIFDNEETVLAHIELDPQSALALSRLCAGVVSCT